MPGPALPAGSDRTVSGKPGRAHPPSKYISVHAPDRSKLPRKIAVAVGTRPEIIKMSPVIRELQRRENAGYYVIHSGQHYSYRLDRIFFEQLKLPRPKYRLEVGSGHPARQTALIIAGAEKVFLRNRPDVVLVQGDTNTVLGVAVAASKLGIPVGHVEAGLRSYDRSMPEELNRRLTDHCSDYLFAPTADARDILLGEGIPRKRVLVTGNTIVDAVLQNIKYARKPAHARKLREYVLVSLHRQENVDDPKRFRNIAESLKQVCEKFRMPVIYPIHPRSKKMARKFGIDFGPTTVVQPTDYFTFLGMQKDASLVMTDSGGIQEEACILGVPCVTLRDNTERPETVRAGSNMVAGTEPKKILRCAGIMMGRDRDWKNPFGRGDSAEKIVRAVGR